MTSPAPAVPTGRSLPHVPALDGLRGAAVIGVLAFHAGHLGGGFLGVDLFFVLSGFLITGLLLAEADDTGRIDLLAFWARRVRRLLPALLLVVVAVMAYGAGELAGPDLADLRSAALGTLGYVANWVAIGSGHDYWAAFDEPGLLDHTWSLAIEEQFYLVWPVVAFVAIRLTKGRRRPLVLGTIALTAASLTSLWLHQGEGAETSRAYYGTDTRAAAVLYGALIALVLTARPRRSGDRVESWLAGACWPAAVLLGWLWVVADGTDGWLYLWGLPLAGVSAAVIIAAATSPRTHGLHRLLGWRPLCWIGLISYGLYLWHWPVYQVLDEEALGAGGLALTAARIGVSLAIAVASYHLLERPIRRGAVQPRVWRLAVPSAIAGVAVLVLAVAWGTERQAGDIGDQIYFAGPETPDSDPPILLVGDSQALPLMWNGPALLAGHPVHALPVLGCGIGPGVGVSGDRRATSKEFDSCDTVVDRWLARIAKDQPSTVLLHAGAWDVLDRDLGDHVVRFGTEEWDQLTEDNMRSVLRALGGSKVVAFTAPCFAPDGEGGGPPERSDVARVQRWNELLRSAAADVGARVLEYGELVCPGGTYRNEVDGFTLHTDGVHLTDQGAVWAWQRVDQQLVELLGTDERA